MLVAGGGVVRSFELRAVVGTNFAFLYVSSSSS